MTTPNLNTRESWLDQAVLLMRPWFDELNVELPKVIKVSVGWSKGAKGNTVGTCWPSTTSADNSTNIFIMPERDDNERVAVLGTLLHEMNHASDNCESKHAGHFAKLNRRLGFLGKPTSSAERTVELNVKLTELGEILGVYPHAAITPNTKETVQKTYQRPFGCMEHDFPDVRARMTRKQYEFRPPLCGEGDCGLPLEEYTH